MHILDFFFFFFQAEDGIRDYKVTGVQTCALPILRDVKGEKMSKSKNNVIDPIDVMDQYGTDALRFTLATSSSPGNDMKLVPERIIGNRNFANKIWNATRFVLMVTSEIGGGIPAIDEGRSSTLAE